MYTARVSLWVALLLSVCASVAPAQTTIPYNSGTIAVPSNLPWTDTGVDILVGDEFFISAGGFVAGSPIVPGILQFYGPEGVGGNCSDPYRPLPGSATEALIGKIGGNGGLFHVGSQGHFYATSSGRLYLGPNDGYPGDNTGDYVAFVHVTRPEAGNQPLVAPEIFPPVIDGTITDTEWQGASVHTITMVNGYGATAEAVLYLGSDGSNLYVGLKTPVPNGWDVYNNMILDGDLNDLANGSTSAPHIDIITGRPCPSGWGGYVYYMALPDDCQRPQVTPPAGYQMAVAGNPASYERKIPLSDLGITSLPDSLRFGFLNGFDGTPQGSFGFPYHNTQQITGGLKKLVILDAPSAVNGGGAGGEVPISLGMRNPYTPNGSITYGMPAKGDASIEIYDASGRLVRTLAEGPVAGGTHQTTWDGTDDRGRPAPNGMYFMKLYRPEGNSVRKFVLTK